MLTVHLNLFNPTLLRAGCTSSGSLKRPQQVVGSTMPAKRKIRGEGDGMVEKKAN